VSRARARVLVVGIGGLGCPAALALARAGIGTIGLADDDEVDRSNLHRQILFGDADVGASKLDAAARALRSAGSAGSPRAAGGFELRLHHTRLLPHNALSIVGEYDVVLEGSDNFATKFLTADACALAGVAVVHASAVRWIGTALAVAPGGKPCYRCLFEDVPAEGAANCAEAGVMGPVVGVVAAAQVDLALAWIDGVAGSESAGTGGGAGEPWGGRIVTYDGRVDALRRRTIPRRSDCPLCGSAVATGRIERIDSERYVAPACAG
jgi:adenylyltransferase/sulfurtransferase